MKSPQFSVFSSSIGSSGSFNRGREIRAEENKEGKGSKGLTTLTTLTTLTLLVCVHSSLYRARELPELPIGEKRPVFCSFFVVSWSSVNGRWPWKLPVTGSSAGQPPSSRSGCRVTLRRRSRRMRGGMLCRRRGALMRRTPSAGFRRNESASKPRRGRKTTLESRRVASLRT